MFPEMQQTITGPSDRRMVVCYMQSWAAYRAPPLAFTASLVPRACTHLHYAFAAIHPHTYAVIPANEDYDIIKGKKLGYGNGSCVRTVKLKFYL